MELKLSRIYLWYVEIKEIVVSVSGVELKLDITKGSFKKLLGKKIKRQKNNELELKKPH